MASVCDVGSAHPHGRGFWRWWTYFADHGRADGYGGSQCRRCWHDWLTHGRGAEMGLWMRGWLMRDESDPAFREGE